MADEYPEVAAEEGVPLRSIRRMVDFGPHSSSLHPDRTEALVWLSGLSPTTCRHIRRSAQVGVKELAHVLGITVGSLCRLETGKTVPQATTAWRWASALMWLEDEFGPLDVSEVPGPPWPTSWFAGLASSSTLVSA